MTDEQIFEIFRKIASGERRHGSFLTAFSEAVIRADRDNFQILRPVAERLADKYSLNLYAKETT